MSQTAKGKALGELFAFKNGRAFKKEEWSDHGLPIIRIQNLNSELAPFNLYGGEYSTNILVKEGDLLFSWSGTVGSSFGPHIWQRAPGVLNQHIFKVTAGPDVNNQYAYYALRHITEAIEEAVNGAVGLVHITKEKLSRFQIPVPLLGEQRRIVGILDKAFAAIATAKANTEKNLQNARALFESSLQAVFSRSGGWPEKLLGDVAKEFGRGRSKHRPRNDRRLYGGEYPFVQTGDVRGSFHVIKSYGQTYNEVGLAQSKLWPAGTVCITIAANIAETGILAFDACFPDSIIGVVADESKTTSGFLEYMLRSFKSQLQARGKGSAQDNINVGTFENHPFPFPDLNTQRKIVAALDSVAAETQRLESTYTRKLAVLDELKKSLLHEGFNGRL